jgi:hypothetical protein
VPQRHTGHGFQGRGGRLLSKVASLLGVAALSLGPLALGSAAAGGLTMDARILLQGHARAGAWSAIAVDLQNDGPGIVGELRMDGGQQSNVRYAMAVDLPTGSRQTYVLHAQPPAFGRNVKVDLVAGDGAVIDSVTVAYVVHESTQLVVGVLAELPAAVVKQVKLPNSSNGTPPAIVPLTIADLPERAEGWSALDRLVWQDVDSNQLSTAQLDALRRWLAAGGRLVIIGGSAGIGTLSAFPDDLLPYRPTATLDVDPSKLQALLGTVPDGATELPAMAGELARGRALATSGDRAVAADMAYGNGRVTVLGFDPTTAWLAESTSVEALWRGVLPDRFGDSALLIDDSQLVNAVYQLPSLALPPTGGLLAIIAAYILIIGPINYLVLKRLDRRELAWITMPVLVIAFAGASFGYGAVLRGTDVVINEVAIVRAAPDATEGTAQVYFGLFSPNRATYQVNLPDGALLAAPINADPFGQGTSNSLDIVQGTGPQQPSIVRNLSVGTGSIRVVRAQLPVTAPRLRVALNLVNNTLVGTVENASDKPLEGVAVVLGSSVAVLGNVAAHTTKQVNLPVRPNPFGSSLADQVIGQSFDPTSEASVRRSTRYSMVQQLTFDPNIGFATTGLPSDQAVILAFDSGQVLDLQVGSEQPRRNANVMYYVPVGIGISGDVTFTSDLLRTTVIESNAQFFSKDRSVLNMGQGSATVAYRPIPFEGKFHVSEIRLNLGQGGVPVVGGGKELEPLPEIPVTCLDSKNQLPEGCAARRDDFLPEIEVFDRTGEGAWVRLPRLAGDQQYRLANPTRYVDPTTGQMLVRFVNDNLEMSVGFAFQLALVGKIQ